MSTEHKQMVMTQIISRGIENQDIANAFLTVSKRDFVNARFKKIAYIDSEIKIDNENFILRPYILAKILHYIINIINPKNILIKGDITRYTTNIFSVALPNVNIVRYDAYPELEKQFDVIFFDSRFYNNSEINDITMKLLNEDGTIIYLKKSYNDYFIFNSKIIKNVSLIYQRNFLITTAMTFDLNLNIF